MPGKLIIAHTFHLNEYSSDTTTMRNNKTKYLYGISSFRIYAEIIEKKIEMNRLVLSLQKIDVLIVF